MAHKKNYGPKRQTQWLAAVTENSFTAGTAGTLSTTTLVAGVASGFTLLRIVGSGLLMATNPSTDDFVAYWGIYSAPEAGALLLDPSVSADITKESWLHWNAVYSDKAQGASDTRRQSFPIDIRVKRKMAEEDVILLAFKGISAYTFCWNLRALVMLP